MFYRIGVFKISWKLTGKHLCWSAILIKLQNGTPFLQQATSSTSNKQILKRVTSEFLQRVTSAISKKWFLQRATYATSNEQILQRVTSDFTTINE